LPQRTEISDGEAFQENRSSRINLFKSCRLKAGFKQAMGLFLAQACPVCDRSTAHTFCLDCQRQIYPRLGDSKKSSQVRSEHNSQPNKVSSEPGLLPICALGLYSGSLKRAILAMKYGDRPDVAAPLGAALAQHWLAQQPTALSGATLSSATLSSATEQSASAHKSLHRPRLYAVPIPLHAERQKSRGFNQAELIARAFCQISELPLLSQGLVRTQSTRPQHELGLAERQQNLNQVFQVGQSLQRLIDLRQQGSRRQGKATPTVLLVDDIYTTGATAQSAAMTLRRAGISVAGIVAVAQAEL
jgi:predicted amidophosphoribosyltransferase